MFCVSVVISRQNAILLKRLVQLSSEIIAEVLFLDKTIRLWYAAKALCILPMLSQNIKKTCTQVQRFFKLNNFDCFISSHL